MIAEDAGEPIDQTSVNLGNNSRHSIERRRSSCRQRESVISFPDETPSVSCRPSCTCSGETARDGSTDSSSSSSCRSESIVRLHPRLSYDDLKRCCSAEDILPVSSAGRPRWRRSLESGFDDDDVRFFGNPNCDDTLSFVSSSSGDDDSSIHDDVYPRIVPLRFPTIGRTYHCGQLDAIERTVAGKAKDCSDAYQMSDGSDGALRTANGSDNSSDVGGTMMPVLMCLEVSPSVSVAADCVDGYLAVNTSMRQSTRTRWSKEEEDEAFLDAIVTSLRQRSDRTSCASDASSLYRLYLGGDTMNAGASTLLLDRLACSPCADDVGLGFPELRSTVGGNWRVNFPTESSLSGVDDDGSFFRRDCCSEFLPNAGPPLTDLSYVPRTDRYSADFAFDEDMSSELNGGAREAMAELKFHADEEETLSERWSTIKPVAPEEFGCSDGTTFVRTLSYSLTQELPETDATYEDLFASSDCDLPPLRWCRSCQDDVRSDECADYLASTLPSKFSDYGPPPTFAVNDDDDACGGGGLSSFGRLFGGRARVCFEDDCGIRRNRTHTTVCRPYQWAEQLCAPWGSSCDAQLVPLVPVRCSRSLTPRCCPAPRPLLRCCETPKVRQTLPPEREAKERAPSVEPITPLTPITPITPLEALPSTDYLLSTSSQTPVREGKVPKKSESNPVPVEQIVPEDPEEVAVVMEPGKYDEKKEEKEEEEVKEEDELPVKVEVEQKEEEGICDPSELLACLPPCDPCDPCSPCCSFCGRCDPCCRPVSTSDSRCGGCRCVRSSVGTSVTQTVSRWKRRRGWLEHVDDDGCCPRRGAVNTWIRSLSSKALDFGSGGLPCSYSPSSCPSPLAAAADLCRSSAVETNRTMYCPAKRRSSCGDDDDDDDGCCWRSVDSSTVENDDLLDSSAVFPTVTSVRFEAQIRSCRRRRGTPGGLGPSKRVDSMLRFLMQPAVSHGHGLDEGDRKYDASHPAPPPHLLLPPPPPHPPPPPLQKNVLPIDENLEKLYIEELMSTIRSTTERFARNLLARGKV